ncbi:MAG: hypothetical protein HY741_15920 [Chloroflexi bacterium]|nr:hypothetical protein [Chloroflexota bacterium]
MNSSESGCIRTLATVAGVVAVVVAIVAWIHPFPSVGWSLFDSKSTPTAEPIAQITQSPVETSAISTPTLVKVASAKGIEIAETGTLQPNVTTELLRLNNCGGTRDSEQVSTRETIVNLQGDFDDQATREKVFAKYARVIKSQKVIAAPGTWMEFVLTWTEQDWIGIVKEGVENKGTYIVRVPMAVELASSKNLGCPNTPAPIVTQPVATSVPPTSTPRPTFPPTKSVPPTATRISPAIDGPFRSHQSATIGTGVLESVTFSDGLAAYEQNWLDTNHYRIQRIRPEENPSGCGKSIYNTNKIWFGSAIQTDITINGNVIGELVVVTGRHGFVFEYPLKVGDTICVSRLHPSGYHFVFGPDIYYHYDSYCNRGYC